MDLPIDLMVVEDEIELESVVTNFDLSFCQVWYDGKMVRATHWDDIRQKKGVLMPEYIETYKFGNPFILKRVEKYRDRGYLIETPELNLNIQDLVEKRIELVNQYRLLMGLRHDLEMEDNQDEVQTIQDDIYENSNLLRAIDIEIKKFNPKKMVNTEEWVVTKIYEFMIDHYVQRKNNIAFILRYPLIPCSYARILELVPVFNQFNIHIRPDLDTSHRNPFLVLWNDIFSAWVGDNIFWTEPSEYTEAINQAESFFDSRQLGKRMKSKRMKNKQSKRNRKQSKRSKRSKKNKNLKVKLK
jgi:hypothetical protein